MAIPGLLIEYLVVGVCSLIWILPIIFGYLPENEELNLFKISLLIPVLYVVGMIIDFFASSLMSFLPTRAKSIKRRVRNFVERMPDLKEFLASDIAKRMTFDSGRSSRMNIYFQRHCPNVLKEIELRSSRDRIARCTTFNLLAFSVVLAFGICGEDKVVFSLVTFFLALSSLFMWALHEANTYGYELRAFQALIVENDGKNSHDKDNCTQDNLEAL